jgi:tetratricopeptide (TPR) repeat protein
LGQFEEALAHYDIALVKADKGDIEKEILYNRGLANSSLMRFEEAIEDYKKACIRIADP